MLDRFLTIGRFALIILISVFCLYFGCFKADPWYTAFQCAAKPLAFKGVIIGVTGKSGYRHVQIDNIVKPVALIVDGEIFRKGFKETQFFATGDSIFKSANSKIVTVKNKDSMVVFTMACDD